MAAVRSRGLWVDVDNPMIMWGSVTVAAVTAVAYPFLQPAKKEKGRKSLKRDVIGLGITVAAFAYVAALFINGRSAVAERQRANPMYPRFADGVIALMSFSVLTLSRVVLLPVFERVGRAMLSKEKFGDEYDARVDRYAGQLWKLIYHTLVTVVPLVILRNEKWWPPGFGNSRLVFEDYPNVPVVPWLREFYLFQMGYYIHAMEVTFLQTRARPNFIQMTVHHVAVLGLLVVSYFLQNNTRFGTISGWLHDVCDVPVCLTRLTVDLPYVAPAAVFYALLMVFWVTFRMVIFPLKTVYVGAWQCFSEGWVKREDAYGWSLTTPLLSTLVVLHIVWFNELLGMGKVYLRTGSRADTNEAHSKKEK